MTRRGYSREFKLGLMRQWATGERSCAQLVREHGVGQSVLYRWREEYRRHGEEAFGERAVGDVEALRRQIAQLEQALGKATFENELLKRGLQLARSGSERP
jgi:transposase-like protein